MKPYLILFTIFLELVTYAQHSYPKNYFDAPLKIPIILSGTFGELRSNHFHSGIDIKTQKKEGVPIYAPADGFVSRIKVSQYGFGKALYLNHPNGYTTVYAHLQKFSDSIQNYVKSKQYKKQQYAIGSLFPKPITFPIKKGQIIGYTGNTGSSGGPHLHYEIRDTKTEHIINPFLFNLTVGDSIPPTVTQLMVYPLSENARVNNFAKKTVLKLKEVKKGEFITNRLYATGTIGFGIHVFDRLNKAQNKNGIYSLEMKVNGNRVYYHDVETFSFAESKFINLLIDYAYYKKFRKRIQKTYKVKANRLSLYEDLVNNGTIRIKENTNYIVEIICSDFHKNRTRINIPVKGVKSNAIITPIDTTDYRIIATEFNKFKHQYVTVAFPKNTFYEDCFIDFTVENDIVNIHNPTIPLNKRYTLTFDTSHLSDLQKKQVYIANSNNTDYPKYVTTKKKDDKVYTSTKVLGKYTLRFDATQPTITLVNFTDSQSIPKHKILQVKIEDKETGIGNYRATLDGDWILMEYNHKKGLLTYDFNDKKLVGSKHTVNIVVSDRVGNTSTLNATFFK